MLQFQGAWFAEADRPQPSSQGQAGIFPQTHSIRSPQFFSHVWGTSWIINSFKADRSEKSRGFHGSCSLLIGFISGMGIEARMAPHPGALVILYHIDMLGEGHRLRTQFTKKHVKRRRHSSSIPKYMDFLLARVSSKAFPITYLAHTLPKVRLMYVHIPMLSKEVGRLGRIVLRVWVSKIFCLLRLSG